MNSALLTTPSSYIVPVNFYPGIANTIEIPIIGGILSHQENFQVDGSGNLKYTGQECAGIAVHATFVLGYIEPHPNQTSGSLDVGPKVSVKVYMKVAGTNGVIAYHDVTFYLLAFEYMISNYTIYLNDVFTFAPNDTIKFYAYYDITTNAPPPFNPNNFYVNLKQTYLSICAYSAASPMIFGLLPPVTTNTNTHVEIPIGANVNTVIHKFKPNVSGLTFLQTRINIPSAQGYINSSGSTAVILNVNWKVYLSINGVLHPQYVTFESSGNQPYVLNSPSNVFTSTLCANLLADLRLTDEIQVICNCTDVFVLIPTAPFFTNLTDGKVIADFSTNSVINRSPLYPRGLLKTPNNNLIIPLDTDMSTAVEFPLIGANLMLGNNFTYTGDGILIYTGLLPRWVKICGAINIVDLQLNTSDSDTATVFLSTYGLFIGTNGESYNNLVTETNIYRDTRNTLKLLSNQTTENYIKVKHGDRVSVMIYAYNTVYITGAPVPGVLVKRPAVRSMITITGNVNLTVE